MKTQRSLAKKIAACGGIMVFFIMALEVMIMISPFAFFFYYYFVSQVYFFKDRFYIVKLVRPFFHDI